MVVPRMLALDCQPMRRLALELWLLEVLSVVRPLVTICRLGLWRAAQAWSALEASCLPHWASHAQGL